MVNISDILVSLIRKEENASISDEGVKTASFPNIIYSRGNNSYHFESTNLNDVTPQAFEKDTVIYGNITGGADQEEESLGFFMANIRLLKAIVLGVVVLILILSACKFVLKIVSRYNTDDSERKD